MEQLDVTDLLEVTLDTIDADPEKKERWRQQAMAEFDAQGLHSAKDLVNSDEFFDKSEMPAALATRLRESLENIKDTDDTDAIGVDRGPSSPRGADVASAAAAFRGDSDDRRRRNGRNGAVYTYRQSSHFTTEQLSSLQESIDEHDTVADFHRNLEFCLDSGDIQLYGRRSLALKRSIEMVVGGTSAGATEPTSPRSPRVPRHHRTTGASPPTSPRGQRRGRVGTLAGWIRASREGSTTQMPRASAMGKQREHAGAFITDVAPVAVTFEGLTFKLNRPLLSRFLAPIPCLSHFAKPEKYLLTNVCGHIPPGSLIALIGPSGMRLRVSLHVVKCLLTTTALVLMQVLERALFLVFSPVRSKPIT
jgi:ABC-type multidrug transport system fused ATPase/permease subunit